MREQHSDPELDAALARYAAVEPGDGLELRILTNLRAQDARAVRSEWRRWLVAGFAISILGTLAIWVGERNSVPLNTNWRLAQREMAGTSAQVRASTAMETPSERKPMNDRTRRSSLAGRNARENAGTIPKLAQFPAPQPLTEQEKLLIRFVEQDPEDAVLVAQEATERLRRETEEIEGSGADTLGEQQVQ